MREGIFLYILPGPLKKTRRAPKAGLTGQKRPIPEGIGAPGGLPGKNQGLIGAVPLLECGQLARCRQP